MSEGRKEKVKQIKENWNRWLKTGYWHPIDYQDYDWARHRRHSNGKLEIRLHDGETGAEIHTFRIDDYELFFNDFIYLIGPMKFQVESYRKQFEVE